MPPLNLTIGVGNNPNNMSFQVAINGFGRIGRCILRAYYERGLNRQFSIKVINELADIDSISYLLRYDSTYGRFAGNVMRLDEQTLSVNDERILVTQSAKLSELDWSSQQIDLVLECTGTVRTKQQAQAHIRAGAKQVLISNPADKQVDYTLIYGWNQDLLTGDESIISNGSCSTNCLIPVLDMIDEAFGIEAGTSTTIHSAMNDQPTIDAYHSELRLTRAAGQSMVPIPTQLSQGITRLMPKLANKIESLHIRVPTQNVSVLDVNLQLKHPTDAQSVNKLLESAADSAYSGILGITREPHASIDFNQDPRSGVVDLTQTKVSGKHLLKLLIWFDNEWGFANRMLDSALYLQQLKMKSSSNNV